MLDCIEKLDFDKAGQHAGKMGMTALQVGFVIKGFKNLYQSYKSKGWQAFWGQGIKAGIQDFDIQQKELAQSKALFDNICKGDNYKQALEVAKKNKIPVEAFNKQLKKICDNCKDETKVFQTLKFYQDLSKHQGVHKINGIDKPVKFDFVHIFGVEFKNGLIKGGHSKINLTDSKIQVLHEEIGPNNIGRGILYCPGFAPKESTFFPKDWSPEKIMIKTVEAANNAGVQNLLKNINSKGQIIAIGKTSEGIDIQFTLHVASGRIDNTYVMHPDWPHGSLLEKIYGKNN